MCRANGGKIRTQELGDGKYRHVCILNGKMHMGEVKTKMQARMRRSSKLKAK